MNNNVIKSITLCLNNYPILRDFNNLWNKIQQDNNLTKGRNYYNHTATWYGAKNYAYPGIEHKAQDMPHGFTEIAKDIEQELDHQEGYFNCLLINSFKNKGIGAHADNESIFRHKDGTVGTVATLCLGGSATITIARNYPPRNPFQFETHNGSCYIMPDGNFQNEYKHAIGRSSEPRISLTFRHTP